MQTRLGRLRTLTTPALLQNHEAAYSSLRKRRSPPFRGSNFIYSKARLLAESSRIDSINPQFQKLPESLQKDRSTSSVSQTNDLTRSHEDITSKKSRLEHPASSLQSLVAKVTDSKSSTSAQTSKPGSTSTNFLNRIAFDAKHWREKRPSSNPNRSKCMPLDSTSPKTTMDRPSKRPVDSTTEHINPNGTKVSRASDINVPTIDRQIQHPPPDLPSLTKVLQQVPTILTDLNDKQTQLIRELTVRVNDQEKEIKALRSENGKLNQRIGQTETHIAESVNRKFADIESRFGDQIRALRDENDHLTEHVNTMGESLVAQLNKKLASIKRKLAASSTPTPLKGVVRDLHKEDENKQDEPTGLFTPLTTPQK